MKIVVIGGTGLVGSKTVAILREGGHEVVAGSPKSGVNSITGKGLKEAMAGAQVAIDLVTLFAQNGDGLRADQAGAPDNDNLHGLPRLSTIQSCNPGEKSPWISAPT